MEKISIPSYAFSFWRRDILSLVYSALFSLGIFFFLILSFRLQFFLNGKVSLVFPTKLESSPEFLFYISVISFIFLFISILIPRLSDLGVMMAVGGNPWICVQIYLLLCIFYTFPSFLFASILNYFIIEELEIQFLYFLLVHLSTLGIYFLCLLFVVLPFIFIATARDPYSSIRRVK